MKFQLLKLAIFLFILSSCDSHKDEIQHENTSITEESSKETKYIALFFGEKFDTSGAVLPKEFKNTFSYKDSTEIKVKAYVNKTCKKNGSWMVLNLEDGDEMRVSFKDYGFFVPKNADNYLAIVKGHIHLDSLAHKKMRQGSLESEPNQKNTDSTKQDKVKLGFEASGVMLYMPESVAEEEQRKGDNNPN